MDSLSKTFGKLTMSLLVLLAISFSALPALGQYGGGSGTAEDPYLISTPAQMNTIGAMILDYDKHFRLMANIDLSGYTGTSFFIIGSSSRPFTGVFDGNGHTISNFTYTSTGTDNIGVFGYVDGPGAEIKDLGLISPDVDAGSGRYVGALVAYNAGIITNCYVSGGNVSAGDDAGGLVGLSSGKITNCYATGIISGDRVVGGLAGTNEGTILDSYAMGSVEGRLFIGGLAGLGERGIITNCFSTGSVSATGSGYAGGLVGAAGTISHCYSTASVSASGGDRVGGLSGMGGQIFNSYATGNVSGGDYAVGGLVGEFWFGDVVVNCYSTGSVSGTAEVGGLVGSNRGMISGCFWDTQTSGRSNMCGGGSGIGCDDGNGKTTAEMQDMNTFLSAGWDFVNQADGPSDDWAKPGREGGYMILWWQLPEDELPALPTFSGGTGGPNDPYLISNTTDLNRIGHNGRLMDRHFRLINDIDLAGIDLFFIGNRGLGYRGVFDGNGHTILNFTHSSTGRNNVGLFGGIAGEDAEVKDLGLIDPDIDAGAGISIGSLVGWFANGTVSGCYVDGGIVSGDEGVGGLAGIVRVCTISNCYSTASVSGTTNVGGLVGSNSGTIIDCHSTGTVLGGAVSAGGLVGKNGGTVANCHSSCDVSGEGYVGGLVGMGKNLTNCYATGSVSGVSYVGGLVGSGGVGVITDCYATGSVSGTTRVGGLVGENNASITNSFWDKQTSGRSNMCGGGSGSGCDDGSGKTTGEMQDPDTFLNASWDFVGETINGTEDIWRLCNEGGEYPELSWQYLLGDFVCPDGVDWSDLAVLCEQWLQVGAYSADIAPAPAGDGIVNFPDFAALADNWLTGL